MGTNYYVRHKDPELSRLFDDVHVGKSSCGWYFNLRVHPLKNIRSLDDWKRVFENEDIMIVDEYGRPVSTDRMMSVITERTRSDLKFSAEFVKDMLRNNPGAEFDRDTNLFYMAPDRERFLGTARNGGPWCLCLGDFS